MSISLILQSLTIIASPLYILRLHFIIPTTLLEILILATVLVSLIEFARDGWSFRKLRTHFDLIILLFLVSGVVSVFVSVDFLGGLGILKAYFVEPILFYYCLVYTSYRYGSKYILLSGLVSGIWLSGMAVLQKVTGSFTLAPYEIVLGRVTAVYNSANSLALYLGPLAILALALFLEMMVQKEKEKIDVNLQRVFFLLIFLLFVVVIIWTKSRGGMIAEAISLLIFSYAVFSSKLKILQRVWYIIPALSFSLIAVFLYLVYLNYNFIPPDYGKPYTRGDTLQIRYFIWAGTINMLKDHPIFGAGLNGFKTLYSNQYRIPQFQEQFQYPHSLILTFWTETGLGGLTILIALMVESFSVILRNIVESRRVILGAGLLAILSYEIIHGVVDVPYFKNDLSLEFWMVVGLIEIWSRKFRKSS